MAPSRRKGLSKAAAAAAARRQWKVGDLVLAKVKGFPAWPATVSEPEKWGYSADWKKVVVFFFGTQQIAFCNPADVEAFTEEKKESLLGKRHGKGSDFVRAVHEIIDSYEKLKKQEQAVNDTSCNEITLNNGKKLAESLPSSELKDEAIVRPCQEKSFSTRAKHDPSFPADGVPEAMEIDALSDKKMPSDDLTGLMVTQALTPAYVSRRKVEDINHRKEPSARRSRSSLRVDSHRVQNFTIPSCIDGSSARTVAGYILRDKSARSHRKIRKSPDISEGHGTDSPAKVSNCSLEENGSEIVTGDSDTHSFNEGCTIESDCKLLQADLIFDYSEGNVNLSQSLEFQTKGVIKKKRKPNRKRVSSDTTMELTNRLGKKVALENEFHKTELSNRLVKEAGSETEVHKTRTCLPIEVQISNELITKEDGDEHLPLVKRARVRMGRTSPVKEHNTIQQREEKCTEVPNCLSRRSGTSLESEECSPADINPVVNCPDDSSPLNLCLVNRPQVCEVKKKQQFGGSVDGEAALPPSKRLQRALEAMSANVAEDGQTSSEAAASMKTSINEVCVSSSGDCSYVCMESRSGSDFGIQKDSSGNGVSQDGTSSCSVSVNPTLAEESAKFFVEVAPCSTPVPVPVTDSPKPEHCKDVLLSVDSADSPELTHSCTSAHITDDVVEGCTKIGGKEVCYEGCQDSVGQMLRSDRDCETENSELDKPSKEVDHSELSVPAPVVDSSTHKENPSDCSELPKLQELALDEKSLYNEMGEVAKETKDASKNSDVPSPTQGKALVDNVHGVYTSHSVSPLGDDFAEKVVSRNLPSSSPTDGLDSAAHVSTPSTLICSMSVSDNCNSAEKDSCTMSSPDFHLHNEKRKHIGRWSNRLESDAALASFAASLGKLTRTKESIGRATRIAIDCAKFGSATKVLEILVRGLENESSLHKKVDLFFLVDSIAQCSRGLKGNICGIYPSAVQAVLPRLLLAAAPPGSSAQENRRQCLKVLRVWQERRILPDHIIRHHIRELDYVSCSSSAGVFSRRLSRTERAFDDPIREMEGMQVDEYGSNSSFQLPGFRMPPMLKDEDEGSGGDSDGEGFEAVTPEHNSEQPIVHERIVTPSIEKHRHILEDVDGELEMEDVAPSPEAKMNCNGDVSGVMAAHHYQIEQHFPLPPPPPLPEDVPLTSPPLPTSPPPPLPPPPLLPPALPDHVNDCHNSNPYMGRHSIEENSANSINQQSGANGFKATNYDTVHYGGEDTFNSQPLSRQPFHLRPPHPAPSNQFSYVQTDQQAHPRRDIPHMSHPDRFHFVQNTDNGNYHCDHDRMNIGPPEFGNGWRFPPASFSGPCYPDNARCPPVPYPSTPCEPAMPNHRWPFPPRNMHHREMTHHRPSSRGPIPVELRGPTFWEPR